ncbi:MAG: hypothetical protein IJV22_09720 [Bacteroidales bacterium]|nr:hypothetical protein [Bacteroidales bacterium]
MKRIGIPLIIAVLLSFGTAQAQLTHYGARFGLGPSYVGDDLITSSPIVGMDLGAYVNYGFTEAKSFWADNLYLQAGFNIVRRGTNFKQELKLMQSIRTGYFHLWYAQIPILACWRYELPTRVPGNIVNLYVGPSFSVGLFGRLWDRQITPGAPQESINYDTYITEGKDARRAFKHARRLDVALRTGVGYQKGPYRFDLFWEHGFVALMKRDDILNNLDKMLYPSVDIKNRNSYTGSLNSFILSVSYELPIN